MRIIVLLTAALVGASTNAFVTAPIAARASTSLDAAALIIQNKGGGHGEIGYQLAKYLREKSEIDSITILQDDACKDTKEPFKSYSADLPDVKIIKAPLGNDDLTVKDLQSLLEGASFDYIWDNASKKPEGAGKACADIAKSWDPKLYVYVSSAGVYQPDETFPMPETTPIKESAGQAQFESYCVEQDLPLVSFRPQYIYGEKSNKFDYIDYYFDRLVRELPIPIPGDGTQLVSLTNSKDVASLLASPLNNPQAAIEQRYFNCGTDQLVSYDQVAKLCAQTAGIRNYNIEHYDGDLLGKANFPFRLTNFYVAPDVAKAKLGWTGAQHSLADDLKAYYENYQARGGPTKKMSLVKDWEVVVGHKTSHPEYMGSIYDKYDPLVIE